MHVVILAAGQGRRLGSVEVPKPMTRLIDGSTILERQIQQLLPYFKSEEILIVVGYRRHVIEERFPEVATVYNPRFTKENTAKSLLRAMEEIPEDDLLWLNGDVVFREGTIPLMLKGAGNRVLVNQAPVHIEEIKYFLNSDGSIAEISKTVQNPVGEALGVNIIVKDDFCKLRNNLILCSEMDYFEKALERCIEQKVSLWPIKVDADSCIEIDFSEDLIAANKLLKQWSSPF